MRVSIRLETGGWEAGWKVYVAGPHAYAYACRIVVKRRVDRPEATVATLLANLEVRFFFGFAIFVVFFLKRFFLAGGLFLFQEF